MIGTHYWTTGITLTYSPFDQKWTASVEFFDDGFAEGSSTGGNLHTRYYCSTIEKAIDLVLEDAKQLGIKFLSGGGQSNTCKLYIQGHGIDPNFPPPDDWKQILHEQAHRIGWESAYEDEGAYEMPRFRVPVSWCMQGYQEMSVKSYDELILKLDQGDLNELPPPKKGEMIAGSMQVEDFEDILSFNKDKGEWELYTEEEEGAT